MVHLTPTKQKLNKKRLFSFDIETYDNNKKFLCASIIGKNQQGAMIQRWYTTKEDFIKAIKTDYMFRDSYMCATNLSFDFFGIFFNREESKHFTTLFRGTDLLYAKTYYDGDSFTSQSGYIHTKKSRKSITFLDSMNYCSLSVEKMGKVLGKHKLPKPEWLGSYPTSDEQWKELYNYNIQDSVITYEYMRLLFDTFESLGATVKKTIASTAMSLYRNKYLDSVYYQGTEESLLEQFNAFYGGRTEAFKRGYISECNYYDINSLYPSVMHDYVYPDVNTIRITHENSIRYISSFEGISHVKVYCPYMTYPVLPYKKNHKILFPVGTFEGWYTHIELRKAIEKGYVIQSVYKTYYTTKTCTPFVSYVSDVYQKRLLYQQEGSPMELVTKLLLNGLYGKFGQRFIDRENAVHVDSMTKEQLQRYDTIERVGDYFITKERTKPAGFCIPLWACYITAYARLRLYDYIERYNPIYCDTDSIITKDTIETSSALGCMKKEMTITEGIIVRPKFYAIRSKERDYVKIKGLGVRLVYTSFSELLHNPKIAYTKFAKFRESIRHGYIPNELIDTHKEFSLEDEKREWLEPFSDTELQYSEPRCIIPEKQSVGTGFGYLAGEDTYDSKGTDISKDEFLANEIFFSLRE